MSAVGVDRATRAFAAVIRKDPEAAKAIILEDPNATELFWGLLTLGAAALEELARQMGVSTEVLLDQLLLVQTKRMMREEE